jgi:ribosomal protein S18 acetylase RimI-like enzyme
MLATERPDQQAGGAGLTRHFTIRPAGRADAPAIANLLLEGFGHEYGGLLRQRGGRRFIERIHALPGRLQGLMVAVDDTDTPIGVAGMRTREQHPRTDGAEERAMFEELGIGAAIWLDLRAALTEPSAYRPRIDEAYIYSVSVTESWRGHGVASRLLDALHNRARSYGKRYTLLEVAASNRGARKLYERLGYVTIRRRRGLLAWLPLGAPTLLLMRRQL